MIRVADGRGLLVPHDPPWAAVKLLWFHLMPYPELPEDFNRTHRSVWVDIDPALFDRGVLADCYERYIDQLVHAEACGFDGICVNEHHSNGYGLIPSPNVIASVLASRTSRAAITVLGNSVALYNPPVRVAEEMAMVDLLSRGRLISGFPVGTSMDTAYAYSVNPGSLRAKYLEGIDLVLRAWAATEPFAFNGRFTQMRYVNVLPRPMQQPHPPVWIPGGGSVETWDFCSQHDFVYAALSYYGHLMAKETVGGYWRQVEANGKDPNPYRLAFLQFIGVADTDQEAYRLYKAPAEYFFNRSLHVYPGYADPPGYVTEASARARYKSQVRAVVRAKQTKHDLSWDEMVEKGYVVIGSPDTVRETLADVARTFNCGHLLTMLQFGNMSDELTRYNSELFADKVAPALRGMFSDAEDHWWPENAR
jgi:alkanesulfonate monooxygenase SsuD/methylene tetrahydromethanopterin reductase-like flavin-dependent oxidoreductase (luciferase family)